MFYLNVGDTVLVLMYRQVGLGDCTQKVTWQLNKMERPKLYCMWGKNAVT